MRPRWARDKQFEARCIVCGETFDAGATRHLSANNPARQQGWKLTYEGWICPKHDDTNTDDAPLGGDNVA